MKPTLAYAIVPKDTEKIDPRLIFHAEDRYEVEPAEDERLIKCVILTEEEYKKLKR